MYSTFYYAGGSAGGALPSVFWVTGGWTACVLLVVAVQLVGAAIAFTQWSAAASAARCICCLTPEGNYPTIAIGVRTRTACDQIIHRLSRKFDFIE